MTNPTPQPVLPRYGERSLADLVPSLLAALGLPGFRNPLAVEPVDGLCVMVVDGLGQELLRKHCGAAPFLASAAARRPPLTAGFPATTSASLGSLGTGLAPGVHGLVGYTMLLPGYERPMNCLQWELYGIGPRGNLAEEVPPESLQPHPTLIERAEREGLAIALIGPPEHARSPLTRAILRGRRYEGALTLAELADAVSSALAASPVRAVYAYHPFLDTTGHVKGIGSDEWLAYLSEVDGTIETIANRLPAGWALVVTGDHGMVNLADDGKIDLGDRPDLAAGVRVLAGEARARHVHTEPGAALDVLAAWREILGDRMWVVPRDEAIEGGWFGPDVLDHVRPRIGDVVAAAFGAIGIVQRSVDPLQAMLVGHHGSLTGDEQFVPFILER